MRRRRFLTGAATLALSPVAARAVDAPAVTRASGAPSTSGTSPAPRPISADAVGWLGHAPPRRRRRDEPETP
jgi:hypothetical protein